MRISLTYLDRREKRAELQYLQVKWAASMSYGLTLEILRDVFPIGDALGKETIRNNVARVAPRKVGK